jgi:hypothetical protein
LAQGNRYSSYRGRKSPGELLLAVLLILIIVAAVGFMLLQRYMVYDEDGNLRLELPDWGGKPSSVQPPVSSEDLNIIIDRKEPEEPDTPTMPEVPVEPEAVRGSCAFWLADTPLEDWNAVLDRLPEDVSGVCLTVKDTEGLVYVDSAAAARLSRRVLSLKKTTGQAVGDLTDAEGVDAIARIVCLLDPRVPILDVRALGLRQKTGYLFFMKYTGITDPKELEEYFKKLGLLYALNVVLIVGTGSERAITMAPSIMDNLLRGVVIPNEQAIRYLYKTL